MAIFPVRLVFYLLGMERERQRRTAPVRQNGGNCKSSIMSFGNLADDPQAKPMAQVKAVVGAFQVMGLFFQCLLRLWGQPHAIVCDGQ